MAESPSEQDGAAAASLEFHDGADAADLTDGDDYRFHNDTHGGLDETIDLHSPDTSMLLPEGPTSSSASGAAPALWSIDYYKQFFDVDTEQVLSRIKASLWPVRNSFLAQIRARADLYGPFWISTTLVFVMAMAGNIANYTDADEEQRAKWHYDFGKVTLAATAIYTYITLVPLSVFGILRWKTANPPSLLETLCVYGYSLFLFIPVSILCIFPKQIGHGTTWAFLVVAYALSVGVLVTNFFNIVKSQPPRVSFAILGYILVAHAILAIMFKVYFFAYRSSGLDFQ